MPRDDFRRELNDAFEQISGAPGSDLQAQVRSALVDAPERRRPLWLAGVAATVIALLVIATLIYVGPLHRLQPPTVPGGHGSPTPSPSPSPSPTDNLPGWSCSAVTTTPGNSSQQALIDGLSVGTHTGYDRFVVSFSDGQPAGVVIRTQSSTAFSKNPSGLPVQLEGSYGLLVTINNVDGHANYSGPVDFKPHYKRLVEAQQLEDFEGQVQWGLGLSGPACYRAFFLTGPTRLVIDVQTS